MPKDYFQGVTPSSRPASPPAEQNRSIRNIPINTNTRREHTPMPEAGRPFTMPPGPRSSTAMRRFALWGIALIMLVVLGVVGAAAFRDTSVSVTPRTHPLVIAEDIGLTAYPESSEQAALGGLTYGTIVKTYEEEAAVTANGYTEVSEYASGVVTVYNEYGTGPVRLIKNTRFESPDGLVFRVRDSIVVPGKKGGNPGTITATVYADQPGEKYNIGPVNRLTVPGLKGGDMYDKVYARSSASMAGGFAGAKPKVSEADVAAKRDAMRAKLEERARTDAQAAAAPGSLVFPQLLILSFENLPTSQGADGQALVRERLTASLPSFPEERFARVLASAARADAGEAPVRLRAAAGLSIRRAATISGSPSETVDILVSGNATLIWRVDGELLRQTLAGIPKEGFESAVAGFEGIEAAHAYVRPLWRGSFPSDPARITIDIETLE